MVLPLEDNEKENTILTLIIELGKINTSDYLDSKFGCLLYVVVNMYTWLNQD